MFNAHQLSRVCREPGYQTPGSGTSAPPPFLSVPTNCARAAVRMLHRSGDTAARNYLAQSKVGEWSNHTNASMASNNRAVLDGFEWYIDQDRACGRPMHALAAQSVVTLAAGQINASIDVVLEDGPDLAARIVLWDAPDVDVATAPVIACAFAHAMIALYPSRSVTTIGVWQARRQRAVEVPHGEALAHTAAASQILATM